MSYLKDREIWLSNVPTGNPPAGYFWKFIQNGKVVVRDSSGNNQIMVATSGSQSITGSLTVTGGITGTVSSASYVEYSNVANKPALVSGSAQIAAFGYATTGSNGFNGSQSITGSLTVTGQVVAQTLNVQQVTSSIVYSSGSNIFGNSLANTQQFTGSVGVTGSFTVTTTGTELQVTNTGVNLGNALTDSHIISGSLRVNPNGLFVSGSGNVGIGTTSPSNPESFQRVLNISSNNAALVLSNTNGTTKNWSLGAYEDGSYRIVDGNTPRMIISSGGNVGIGVTPSAWNSTSRALQLPSSISLSQQHNGALNLMSYALETSANTFTYADTGIFPARLNMNPNDGTITLFGAGTGTSGNAITWASRLAFTSAGAATFGSSVTANGTMSLSNDGTYGSTYKTLGFTGNSNGSHRIFAGTADNIYIAAATARGIQFWTNGTYDAMLITSGGNVGIGTTPSERLHLRDTTTGYVGLRLEGTAPYAGSDWTMYVSSVTENSANDFLGFYNNSTTDGATTGYKLRIFKNGNIGIGTDSPTGQLSIKNQISNGSNPVSSYAATSGVEGQNFFNGYYAQNSDGLGPFPRYFDIVSTGSPDGSNGGSNIRFFTNPIATSSPAVERMRITSGGDILLGKQNAGLVNTGMWFQGSNSLVPYSTIPNGINTYHVYDGTNSVYRFYVNGAGTVFATNTTISAISDARLKENIRDLNVGLYSIMQLKPRLFDWKEESGNNKKNVRGFIAQEVEEIFPDLVDMMKIDDNTEYKSLRQDLIPVLVKAIQEQQTLIESLKSRIEILEQ